jgi:hypothetical protein
MNSELLPPFSFLWIRGLPVGRLHGTKEVIVLPGVELSVRRVLPCSPMKKALEDAQR